MGEVRMQHDNGDDERLQKKNEEKTDSGHGKGEEENIKWMFGQTTNEEDVDRRRRSRRRVYV